MCIICSSGDVQTKFYLLPCFLNHVSCYSFNGWYDPFLQVLDILYLLSIHNVLNVPRQEKIKWREIWASRWLFQSHPLPSTCIWLTTGLNITPVSQGHPLAVPVSLTSASAVASLSFSFNQCAAGCGEFTRRLNLCCGMQNWNRLLQCSVNGEVYIQERNCQRTRLWIGGWISLKK